MGIDRQYTDFWSNFQYFFEILLCYTFYMFDDDLEPRNKGPKKPKDLSPMSIDELETYISDMKAEIERCDGEIKRKKAYQEAASAAFK